MRKRSHLMLPRAVHSLALLPASCSLVLPIKVLLLFGVMCKCACVCVCVCVCVFACVWGKGYMCMSTSRVSVLLGFMGEFEPVEWDVFKSPPGVPNDAKITAWDSSMLRIVTNNAGGTTVPGTGQTRLSARIRFSVAVTVSFEWNYTTEERSQFDQPRYSINGNESLFPGFDANDNPYPQSGSFTWSFNQSDVFELIAWSSDGTFGPATITFFNWRVRIQFLSRYLPFILLCRFNHIHMSVSRCCVYCFSQHASAGAVY